MALTDAQYVAFLVKASRRLNRALCLTNTVLEIVVNPVTGDMTTPINEPDIEDILVLQAECLIIQRQVSEELQDGDIGIAIKDGEQSYDDSALVSLRTKHLDSDGNACKDLVDAIKFYKLNNQNSFLVW